MITTITAKAIDEALGGGAHQYLVGALKRPQTLEHVHDPRLNIGMSNHLEPGAESAHVHRTCTEYEMVLSGRAKVLDLESMTEHLFERGDFFVIPPGTPYKVKAEAGTRMVFIKVPAADDKVPVEETPATLRWAESWDALVPELRPDAPETPTPPLPHSAGLEERLVSEYLAVAKVPRGRSRRELLTRDFWRLVLRKSLSQSVKTLAWLASVYATIDLLLTVPRAPLLWMLVGIVVVATLVMAGWVVRLALVYSRQSVATKVAGSRLEIMEGDYVVNMLRRLARKEPGEKLVFTMGYNKSVMEDRSDFGVNPFKGIAKDFQNMLLTFYGMDLCEIISGQLDEQTRSSLDVGSTFTIDLVAPACPGHEAFDELKGTQFSVIFFVNSRYRSSGRTDLDDVEDARMTAHRIVDGYIERVQAMKGGRRENVTFMLAPVGTGAAGNGDLRAVLVSMINDLMRPNIIHADTIIVSVRDSDLIKHGYDVTPLLSVTERLLRDAGV